MVVEPDALRHRHGGLGADSPSGRAGMALADVVQQRARAAGGRARARRAISPSRPSDVADRRALGHGLERVTVDGEPVVRVALRSCAHMLPLRQESHEHADMVERLEDGDRATARGEQCDEGVTRVRASTRRRGGRRSGRACRDRSATAAPPRAPRGVSTRNASTSTPGSSAIRSSRTTMPSPSDRTPDERPPGPLPQRQEPRPQIGGDPDDGTRRLPELAYERVGVGGADQIARHCPGLGA